MKQTKEIREMREKERNARNREMREGRKEGKKKRRKEARKEQKENVSCTTHTSQVTHITRVLTFMRATRGRDSTSWACFLINSATSGMRGRSVCRRARTSSSLVGWATASCFCSVGSTAWLSSSFFSGAALAAEEACTRCLTVVVDIWRERDRERQREIRRQRKKVGFGGNEREARQI